MFKIYPHFIKHNEKFSGWLKEICWVKEGFKMDRIYFTTILFTGYVLQTDEIHGSEHESKLPGTKHAKFLLRGTGDPFTTLTRRKGNQKK